jgi:pimeloyl-ACP methyl ester carboxylesterase
MKKNSTWLDRNEYPFESKFFPVKGVKMHYVDVGRGPVILMVHGSPAWSFVYRKLIQGLSPHYRCIAPDLLGFGLSDKPKNFSYKPEAQADALKAFIEYLNLKDFTLAVHDHGGPIGLSYALQNPKAINHLILLNTWMWSLQGNTQVEKMCGRLDKPLGRFLDLKLNYSTRVQMKKAMGDKTKLPTAIHQQYINALPTPEARQGAHIMSRELIGSSEWFNQLWRQREALKDIPTLILWGMKDPFITNEFLLAWISIFSNYQMVRYADAGHFVQEERGTEMCSLIEGFLTGHQPEYRLPGEDEEIETDRRTVRPIALG